MGCRERRDGEGITGRGRQGASRIPECSGFSQGYIDKFTCGSPLRCILLRILHRLTSIKAF
jgi:hypothetical protein